MTNEVEKMDFQKGVELANKLQANVKGQKFSKWTILGVGVTMLGDNVGVPLLQDIGLNIQHLNLSPYAQLGGIIFLCIAWSWNEAHKLLDKYLIHKSK